MGKRLNPALQKLKLEKSLKNNIDKISENIKNKDFVIAKTALALSLLKVDFQSITKLSFMEIYNNIYLLIYDTESTDELLDKFNKEYDMNIKREDLEVLDPHDYMTYSDFDK